MYVFSTTLSTKYANNPAVEDKVNGSFKPAYGSILFFGDNAVVDGWGAQMPAYHGVSLSVQT
jgi:predicted oxidoreductase (fatty acid repression mutant protein)